MSTAIATTLTPNQIADAQQQAAIIASTITTPVVDSNTFPRSHRPSMGMHTSTTTCDKNL